MKIFCLFFLKFTNNTDNPINVQFELSLTVDEDGTKCHPNSLKRKCPNPEKCMDGSQKKCKGHPVKKRNFEIEPKGSYLSKYDFFFC